MNGEVISIVVSLSGGALLANIFSVILLIGETLRQGRYGAFPAVRGRSGGHYGKAWHEGCSVSDVLFQILRRLRAPLITLIVVYAISVGGLALVPGVDPDGVRQPMSIFHAFYVMSYTATTIGFGELPYPFTDAQRLWVTFSIYLSVIGWAYTLGSVVALANDAPFRALLARSIFNWRVRGHRRAVLRAVRLRPERLAPCARARSPRQPPRRDRTLDPRGSRRPPSRTTRSRR